MFKAEWNFMWELYEGVIFHSSLKPRKNQDTNFSSFNVWNRIFFHEERKTYNVQNWVQKFFISFFSLEKTKKNFLFWNSKWKKVRTIFFQE